MQHIKTLLAVLLVLSGCSVSPVARQGAAPAVEAEQVKDSPAAGDKPFRFTVCGDNRPNWFSEGKFQWTLREMNRIVGGPGAFVLMPGDFDPPQTTDKDLRAAFGDKVVWYPVVGNHEMETPSDMAWVRGQYAHLPSIIHKGPAGCETTTYSFDYGPAHFIVLNEYFTGDSDHSGPGAVGDALYKWLKEDLDATKQPAVFVTGHEPAYPQQRHVGNSLDANAAERDRFWKLLNEHGVMAYICGHTHTYARTQHGSPDWPTTTWQVDSGNTGQGNVQTFIDVAVSDAGVTFDAYSGTCNKPFAKCDSWTVALRKDHASEAGADKPSVEETPEVEADKPAGVPAVEQSRKRVDGMDVLQMLSR